MPKVNNENKKSDGILKKVRSRLFRKKQDKHPAAEEPENAPSEQSDHEKPTQVVLPLPVEKNVVEKPPKRKRHHHKNHRKNKEKVPPLDLEALNEKIVKVNESPTDLPPTPQYPAPAAPLNNPSFPRNILNKLHQYFIKPVDELGTDVLKGYDQLGIFCGLNNNGNQQAANDNSPRTILLSGSLSPKSPVEKEPRSEDGSRNNSPRPN